MGPVYGRLEIHRPLVSSDESSPNIISKLIAIFIFGIENFSGNVKKGIDNRIFCFSMLEVFS